MKLILKDICNSHNDYNNIHQVLYTIFGFTVSNTHLRAPNIKSKALMADWNQISNVLIPGEDYLFISGRSLYGGDIKDMTMRNRVQTRDGVKIVSHTDCEEKLTHTVGDNIQKLILDDPNNVYHIMEYCYMNGITVPNNENVIQYLGTDNIIDKLNLSDDHMNILRTTLKRNHRL